MARIKETHMSLLDVIEVEIAAPHRVRIIGVGKTEKNAEAIVQMAVMRRGVENHFFTTCHTGQYCDGDVLEFEKSPA
jgi:hypothetical protein